MSLRVFRTGRVHAERVDGPAIKRWKTAQGGRRGERGERGREGRKGKEREDVAARWWVYEE